MGILKDLTGHKIGKLTVIKRTEDNITRAGQREVTWLCRCVCGREEIFKARYLQKRRVELRCTLCRELK